MSKQLHPTSKILGINEDVMGNILCHLQSQEFIRFSTLVTKNPIVENILFQKEIQRHLMLKWNLTSSEFHSLDIDPSVNLKEQLPFARPLLEELNLETRQLLIDGNRVIFPDTVGQGNRSVKSKYPFPAAISKLTEITYDIEKAIKQKSVLKILNLLKSIIKMNPAVIHDCNIPQFSIPFKFKDTINNTINSYIFPRSVAYYEIQIKSLPLKNLIRNTSYGNLNEQNGPNGTDAGNDSIECIAVGLSTSSFDHRSKFPGWGK
jgi:hypothetical protein